MAKRVQTEYNIIMKFEWNEAKRKANLIKHGVDFTDAVGVFYDDLALTMLDPKHHNEERLLALGVGYSDKLLLVVNVQKDSGIIRIVSARKATKKERVNYEK